LGAPAPIPTEATNHPAVEVFEFFQRSNEPVNVILICSQTKKLPFLDSDLAPLPAACKQEKSEFF
jgi:hypothetical protein